MVVGFVLRAGHPTRTLLLMPKSTARRFAPVFMGSTRPHTPRYEGAVSAQASTLRRVAPELGALA